MSERTEGGDDEALPSCCAAMAVRVDKFKRCDRGREWIMSRLSRGGIMNGDGGQRRQHICHTLGIRNA